MDNISPPPTQSALIYGETLNNMPHDLYIPPEALQLYLESFEGPLDLLLYLIRKAKFNIIDIPMAALTRQYLVYVETMRKKNLNLAAEYLAMAALLIDIKCKMLLPRPSLDILKEGEDEVGDPRAELVRRLQRYEQIQIAALRLNELPQAGRDFFWGNVESEFAQSLYQPEIEVRDLVLIWQDLLTRIRVRKHHQITAEPLSLREQLTFVLKRLQETPDNFVNFLELFSGQTIAHYVVGFIAILELSRRRLVDFTQVEINEKELNISPLYIKLANNPDAIYSEFEDTRENSKPDNN